MSVTEAVQHLIDEVEKMSADFFAENNVDSFSTYFDNTTLTLDANGASSGTGHHMYFVANLGSHQPKQVKAYNIWVDPPKDATANQKAVVRALKILLDKTAQTTRPMITVAAQ